MLGSLARKLRAMGIDTAYYKAGDDSGLIAMAVGQGRVILTSDRSLASRSRTGAVFVLVKGDSDPDRLRSLAQESRKLGIPLSPGMSLCSVCGGTLETLPRKQVVGRVPNKVHERHREFFACRTCGHLYWKGKHWKKLRSMRRRLLENHAPLRYGRKGGGALGQGLSRGKDQRGSPAP